MDINGTPSNDVLLGTNGNDVVNGLDGNDSLNSGLGQDTVNGGEGTDVLVVDYSANEYSGTFWQKGLTSSVSSTGNGSFAGEFFAANRNGTDFDRVYFSQIERFNITGTQYNDAIRGGTGNDIFSGLTGLDTLTGGGGADTFVLGTSSNIYYDDNNPATTGTDSYALITDFDPNTDTIQLKGPRNSYRLDASPISSVPGTALFVDKPGSEPDELIAIIRGSFGSLNLNSTAFVEAAVVLPGVLSLGATSFRVNEDGIPSTTVTVNRSGGNDGEVTARIDLSGGTATPGADYTSNSVVVRLANGETSKAITLPIINDNLAEGDETINLALTNPTGGATIGAQNAAVLTIIDDDLKPGILAFSNPTYSVNEDGTTIAEVTVTRTGGSDRAVSATVFLSGGTASAPSDYNSTPIVVNFAEGDVTPKTVAVPIVNDSKFELNETIGLSLGNLTGGATLGV